MNEFYHDFEIGFNSWYLVVPALMFLMFMIGASRYALSKKTLKIRRKQESKFYLKLVSLLFMFLSCLLIAIESITGLFQIVDNHLGDSDAAWSLFIVPMITVFLAMFIYELYYACGRMGMWLSYGYLSELQEELQAARDCEDLRKEQQKKEQREREFKMINIKPLYERLDPDFVEVIPPNYNF